MTGSPADVHPVLRRAPAPPDALELLAKAERGLESAVGCEDAGEAYVAVHLAALRAAAAVVAVRGRPEASPRGRRRIRSAWELLTQAAPELAEWSTLFEASAVRRAKVEAGIAGVVDRQDADDLAQHAGMFLRLVQGMLPHQPKLPQQQIRDTG